MGPGNADTATLAGGGRQHVGRRGARLLGLGQRATRAIGVDDAVPLLNAALCTSNVAAGATTTTGRAATDLRVWGPAPSRLEVVNATVAVTTDDPDADSVFATVMKAGGVASSTGSLHGPVTAVQRTSQQEGLSAVAVAAVGQTTRRVFRGSFIDDELLRLRQRP